MKNYFIILIFSYLCCAQHEFMDATLKKIYAYEKDEKYIEATKELQKLLNNTQVLIICKTNNLLLQLKTCK